MERSTGAGGGVVALALTGSVAAYKAVQVARLLLQSGHRVLRSTRCP